MKRGSIREVALFAMLGAMTFAAKMAMAQFPNIEPVSLLVMLLAVCFGWKGLYAVYLYVLLEFAMWGIGLWSVCYLYVWLILFAVEIFNSRQEAFFKMLCLCFGIISSENIEFIAACSAGYFIFGAAGGYYACK